MPKLKEGTILPTDQEDAMIQQGIASDPDTYELSREQFKQLKPGQPVANATKDRITIRLSHEVTTYFLATGKGWQTRMDEALKEYVATHRLD